MGQFLVTQEFFDEVKQFLETYERYYKDEIDEAMSKYISGSIPEKLRYDFEEYDKDLCGVPLPDFTPILLKEIIKITTQLLDHQCEYTF